MEAHTMTTRRDMLFQAVEIIKSREAELKDMMCAETSCTTPFADFHLIRNLLLEGDSIKDFEHGG
jgi:hypothetical protein